METLCLIQFSCLPISSKFKHHTALYEKFKEITKEGYYLKDIRKHYLQVFFMNYFSHRKLYEISHQITVLFLKLRKSISNTSYSYRQYHTSSYGSQPKWATISWYYNKYYYNYFLKYWWQHSCLLSMNIFFTESKYKSTFFFCNYLTMKAFIRNFVHKHKSNSDSENVIPWSQF